MLYLPDESQQDLVLRCLHQILSETVTACGHSCGRLRLIFRRGTATPRSADDLSENCAIEPITILRCFRLPSAPASRHLNSQTSGPRKRVDHVILPFCITSPFLLFSFRPTR